MGTNIKPKSSHQDGIITSTHSRCVHCAGDLRMYVPSLSAPKGHKSRGVKCFLLNLRLCLYVVTNHKTTIEERMKACGERTKYVRRCVCLLDLRSQKERLACRRRRVEWLRNQPSFGNHVERLPVIKRTIDLQGSFHWMLRECRNSEG